MAVAFLALWGAVFASAAAAAPPQVAKLDVSQVSATAAMLDGLPPLFWSR